MRVSNWNWVVNDHTLNIIVSRLILSAVKWSYCLFYTAKCGKVGHMQNIIKPSTKTDSQNSYKFPSTHFETNKHYYGCVQQEAFFSNQWISFILVIPEQLHNH